MIRNLIAAGLLLSIAACDRGPDAPAELPELTVVIDEYTGSQPLVSVRLSPDGTRLLWTQPVDGQSAIFVSNADGTNPVRLTHGIWDRDALWSHDGRWIAYIGEDPDYDVFVVPADGSSDPRQLTSGPPFDLTRLWLPDDSAIAFLRAGVGAMRTYAVPFDGGEPYVLGPDLQGNVFITPSPDGSRWTFTLDRSGETTIWVQQAGSEPRQLTTEGLEEGEVSMWSPDGRYVTYESRRTGTTDIWVADVDTGELRQLTVDVNHDWLPQWSPDGSWIAFHSNRGGQDDIWIVPAAGGQALRVTNDIANESDLHWASGTALYFVSTNFETTVGLLNGSGTPATLVDQIGRLVEEPDLSPDGRTAIFTTERSGNLDIWRVSLDGGTAEPVVASPLDDRLGRFSPDGTRIALVSERAGSPDVWIAPADSGEAVRLTDWPSIESSPAWSPDGEWIVFASNRDSDALELWRMPVRGGEAVRLTSNLAGVDLEAVEFDFSPDGRSIYYVGVLPTANRDLFRVSIDGGEAEPLGASPGIIAGDLSPDGSLFAYPNLEGGWGYIEVIPTAGGAPRRLTQRTERVFQPVVRWSADGRSLFVHDYDYPSDTYDVVRVTWPDGEWQPITSTPGISEFPGPSTADGRTVIVTTSIRSRVLSADVASLMRSGTATVSSR